MRIEISIPDQRLTLRDEAGRMLLEYPVSTALNGAGEMKESGCTPRGLHVVRARIGEGQPVGAVFVGRRPTGEVWSPALAAQFPERDWILTRILWLSGVEPGVNRLGSFDTMQRYIYIHGTPDENTVGQPLSHGCIRMKNGDVLELFERTPAGTQVVITA